MVRWRNPSHRRSSQRPSVSFLDVYFDYNSTLIVRVA